MVDYGGFLWGEASTSSIFSDFPDHNHMFGGGNQAWNLSNNSLRWIGSSFSQDCHLRYFGELGWLKEGFLSNANCKNPKHVDGLDLLFTSRDAPSATVGPYYFG